MIRIRRAVAGLMAVLCLLATPAFGADAVVCFGSHGHVAIEASQDGHCVSDACTTTDVPTAYTKLPTSQCDPCLDVAFSQSPAVTQSGGSDPSKNLRLTPIGAAAVFDCVTLAETPDVLYGRVPAIESTYKILPIRLTCVLQI